MNNKNMNEEQQADLVERYIQALQSGTAFDWSQVPDDPELLSMLRMSRMIFTEGRLEMREEWKRKTRQTILNTGTPGIAARGWFVQWGFRYAAIGALGVFAIFLAVNVATPSGSQSSIGSRLGRFVHSTASTSADENKNTSGPQETPGDASPVASVPIPDATPGTNTNSQDSNNANVNAADESRPATTTFTLDVSDLDPENGMSELLTDFSTDLDEIVNDANDDSLVNMASDVRLVGF